MMIRPKLPECCVFVVVQRKLRRMALTKSKDVALALTWGPHIGTVIVGESDSDSFIL